MMQPRGGGGGGGAVRKGPWTAEEDDVLRRHVGEHGPREWSSIRSKGLLPRTGKSCRLRWVNKLRPDLKTGCKFSAEEERVVLDLQARFGNKWAKIATYLTGRTDNDVKNFWSTRQKRLARISRAPLTCRRSGKHRNRGAPPPSPSPEDPCTAMIPFQEAMDEVGQNNQEEARVEEQHADTPFPAHEHHESITPPSIGFAHAATAQCSSRSACPAAHLSFGDGDGDHPPIMVYPAYLEPIPEDDDYGHLGAVRRRMPEVLFDDLPPELLDYFEPSPPSPPASRCTHL